MGSDHHHGPPHGQTGSGLRNRLLIAFGITSFIVIAQAIGSVVTGSLALLTDTAHALSDSTGLLVAVIAATMMLRPPSSQRTWGFARIEIVAALGQAVLLLLVVLTRPSKGSADWLSPRRSKPGNCCSSASSDSRRTSPRWWSCPPAATRTSTCARHSSKCSTTPWVPSG